MSRPNTPITMSNLRTLEDLIRYSSITCDEFDRVLSGNVSFVDNMFVSKVVITFPSADTDVVVTHSLGTIPIGYIVVRSTAATIVYDGTNTPADPWNANYLKLKATVPTSVTVLVWA